MKDNTNGTGFLEALLNSLQADLETKEIAQKQLARQHFREQFERFKDEQAQAFEIAELLNLKSHVNIIADERYKGRVIKQKSPYQTSMTRYIYQEAEEIEDPNIDFDELVHNLERAKHTKGNCLVGVKVEIGEDKSHIVTERVEFGVIKTHEKQSQVYALTRNDDGTRNYETITYNNADWEICLNVYEGASVMQQIERTRIFPLYEEDIINMRELADGQELNAFIENIWRRDYWANHVR